MLICTLSPPGEIGLRRMCRAELCATSARHAIGDVAGRHGIGLALQGQVVHASVALRTGSSHQASYCPACTVRGPLKRRRLPR